MPALTNGVRQPATTATRPRGPLASSRPTRQVIRAAARPGCVHTVSARSPISSSAVARLGGGSGGGGAGPCGPGTCDPGTCGS